MAEPTQPTRNGTTPTTTKDGWTKLHIWQIQPIRDLLVIGAAIFLVWLGHQISIVTVPMLLALLLAYLFEPLVSWLVRKNAFTRRGAAILIVLLGAVALVGPVLIGGGFATWQGVRLAGRTVKNIDTLLQSVKQPENLELREAVPPAWRNTRDRIVEDPDLAKQLTPLTGPKEGEQPPAVDGAAHGAVTVDAEGHVIAAHSESSDLGRAISWLVASLRENAAAISRRVFVVGTGLLGNVLGIFKAIAALLFGAFLTGFFFFFFCTGWGDVKKFWEGLIPERRKGRVVYLIEQMDKVIAGFVRGRMTVAAVEIVVYTVLYSLIGVPAPLIVGPIMGVLTLIPYASTIAAPVAIALMWLDPPSGWQGQWWWIVGGPLLVLGVVQVLDDYILTPAIQGKATNMDTPTILFASIAGGSIAGFYGILVAIPVAACLKILLKEVFWPRFRAWSEGRAPDLLPIKET